MKFIKLNDASPHTGLPSGRIHWVRIDSIITISNNDKVTLSNGEYFHFSDPLETVLAVVEASVIGKPTDKTIPPPKADKHTGAVTRIVGHYRKEHPTRGKSLKPGTRDWKRIKDRLQDGFPEEDLIKAINGNKLCAWHKGHPGGHSIEYIFRNSTKVEGFIQVAAGTLTKEEEVGHHKGSSEFTEGDRRDVF